MHCQSTHCQTLKTSNTRCYEVLTGTIDNSRAFCVSSARISPSRVQLFNCVLVKLNDFPQPFYWLFSVSYCLGPGETELTVFNTVEYMLNDIEWRSIGVQTCLVVIAIKQSYIKVVFNNIDDWIRLSEVLWMVDLFWSLTIPLVSFPEFSALLVPLIFTRKRGRYYHGDRRSWLRSNNSLDENSSSEYL